MKKSDQTVLLLKKAIFSNTKDQLLKILSKKIIRTKKPLVLFTPNPEQLVLAHKNSQFSQLLDQADYLLPDGIGLVWATKILSFFNRSDAISEKISGIDLSVDFLEWGMQRDWRVLLLGGEGYNQAGMFINESKKQNKNKRSTIFSAKQTDKKRCKLQANSQISGKLELHWLPGYQNVGAPTSAEEATVVKTLRSLKPELVFVAFGAPYQEQWVIDHLDLLKKSGTKIVMVVGGTFDILFGRLRRAPLWMRSLGLEWFYRLIQEPSRARRQLALIKFTGLTFREVLKFR